MKKLNFIISALVYIGVSVLSSSCSKKLDDAYANPNQNVNQPIEQIFPSVIGSLIGSYSDAGTGYGIAADGIYMGRYVQYFGNYTATTSANGGSQFDLMGGVLNASDAFGSMWATFYYGHGQNINYIVSRGAYEQKWDYVGAARALRAWGWLELGNEYANAIIVKEAFNSSLSSFNYDSLQLAYDSCRQACYDALVYLNRTDGNVSESNFAIGDAYFMEGKVTRWKQFVYGVLARSYAYLSNKTDYKADSVIYYANLAMSNNDDNAYCQFLGSATSGSSGTSNYFGPYRGNVGSLRQGAYISDLMSGRNSGAFSGVSDPRAWYMLRENSANTFYGVTPGVSMANSLTSNLRPYNFWGNTSSATATGAPTTVAGRYLFRDQADFPIMTASEMKFLSAEAYYRKGDKTSALAAYKSGISLDFDMLSNHYSMNIPSSHVITSDSLSNYLSSTAIVPSADNLTLTHIMLQKYIALFGWGMQETWADMRRYHYTDIEAATGKQVYANFIPANGNYYINNGGVPVYRVRPRYNSEYLYDIPSLTKVGAVDASGSQVLNYHTLESWFSKK